MAIINRKESIMKLTQRKKETIPVFFAVDDRYVPFLCVSLRSLIDNSNVKYDYHINILIDTLAEENKQLLLDMQTENVRVEFINVAEKLKSLCEKLHMRDYYTKATYYRFFVPEMFPEYRRGIYLDCDIVLKSDVALLYHSIMGRNLVAAITDEIITDIEVFACYSELVLGIPREDYFNAGILVMNLHEMRKINIEQRFAELLSVRTYRVAQDQDYLNVLCHGRVTYVNKYWNKTPMPDSDECVVPHIVHYKINFKPWRYDNVPYAEHFWHYAKKTPFYNYLRDVKASYTDAEKARDSSQYNGLVRLAEQEIADAICEDIDLNFCMEAIG